MPIYHKYVPPEGSRVGSNESNSHPPYCFPSLPLPPRSFIFKNHLSLRLPRGVSCKVAIKILIKIDNSMMKMRTLNKYHAFGRIGGGFEMAFTFSLSIYVYCNIFSITFS